MTTQSGLPVRKSERGPTGRGQFTSISQSFHSFSTFSFYEFPYFYITLIPNYEVSSSMSSFFWTIENNYYPIAVMTTSYNISAFQSKSPWLLSSWQLPFYFCHVWSWIVKDLGDLIRATISKQPIYDGVVSYHLFNEKCLSWYNNRTTEPWQPKNTTFVTYIVLVFAHPASCLFSYN